MTCLSSIGSTWAIGIFSATRSLSAAGSLCSSTTGLHSASFSPSVSGPFLVPHIPSPSSSSLTSVQDVSSVPALSLTSTSVVSFSSLPGLDPATATSWSCNAVSLPNTLLMFTDCSTSSIKSCFSGLISCNFWWVSTGSTVLPISEWCWLSTTESLIFIFSLVTVHTSSSCWTSSSNSLWASFIFCNSWRTFSISASTANLPATSPPNFRLPRVSSSAQELSLVATPHSSLLPGTKVSSREPVTFTSRLRLSSDAPLMLAVVVKSSGAFHNFESLLLSVESAFSLAAE